MFSYKYKFDKLLGWSILVILFILGSVVFGFEQGLKPPLMLIIIDADMVLVALTFCLIIIRSIFRGLVAIVNHFRERPKHLD